MPGMDHSYRTATASQRIKIPMSKVARSSELGLSSLVVTWALMVPLFCIASEGLLWFRAGGTGGELSARFGVLAANTYDTTNNVAVTLLFFAIVPAVLLSQIKAVMRLWRENLVFALIAVWTVASCLWSQFPFVSLQWAPVATLNMLLALYLYQRFSSEQQIRLLLLLGSICLSLSIVLALFFPQYGIDHTDKSGAWKGMYAQKNMCSIVTLLLLPGAFYVRTAGLRFQIGRALYVGLSVFLILKTQSATGRICLAALFAYYFVTKAISRLPSRERFLGFIAAGAIAVMTLVVSVSALRGILLFLGKDSTLTGRTDIWQAVIPSILKHPILGYGYRAFWRGYQGESSNVSLASHWAVTSAHNAFLEVWLTLGAVGVGLVIYSLLRASRDSFICLTAGSSPYLTWCACIIFLTLVTSVDEGALVNPYGLIWMLYILSCVGLAEGARRIQLGSSHA
jgi:exopolysaccharide production protein ExoQ